MKKYRLNKNQKLFLIEYFFLNIYLWYRYAFRYNSTLTSPTYYDTPTIWKIGKYIIIVVFLGMYVVLNGFKIKSSYKKLTILLMAVSIIIFVKAVIVKDIEFFCKMGIDDMGCISDVDNKNDRRLSSEIPANK